MLDGHFLLTTMGELLLGRPKFGHGCLIEVYFHILFFIIISGLNRGWPLNVSLTVLLKLIDTQCKIGRKDGVPSFYNNVK